MSIEKDFKQWLQNTNSSMTGANFKPKTVSNYCRELRKLIKNCSLEESTGINSIYDVTSHEDFVKIKQTITDNEKFKEKNKKGRNTMQSALNQY